MSDYPADDSPTAANLGGVQPERVRREIQAALALPAAATDSKTWPCLSVFRPSGLGPSSEWALTWYHLHGFGGDRARRDFFGYPSLLKDLAGSGPAPELPSPEGENWTLPLGLPPGVEPPNSGADLAELQNVIDEERRALEQAIGVDQVVGLAAAVHASDGATVAEGAPDLLVWFHRPPVSLWFFSEVLAPGDSLRHAQQAWLHRHRELVRGHFLITILE